MLGLSSIAGTSIAATTGALTLPVVSPTLETSKLAGYVIEGATEKLYASKLAVYVVKSPASGTGSQVMLGTF